MVPPKRGLRASVALSLSFVAACSAAVEIVERTGVAASVSGVASPEVASTGDDEVDKTEVREVFSAVTVNNSPPRAAGPLLRRLPDGGGQGDGEFRPAARTNVFSDDFKSARHHTYCARFASADRTAVKLAPRRASLANATWSSSALAQVGSVRGGAVALSLASSASEYGQPGGSAACSNGNAAGYSCNKVDLQSLMTLNELNAKLRPNDNNPGANDIWGWTDADSGREFALIGMKHGVSIVEVTEPTNPVYFGSILGSNGGTASLWHDIKVYNNHAFIVSEASNHGMQVFDLRMLLDFGPNEIPRRFSPSTRYTNFDEAHNIEINEASGYAYAVGTNTCSGGLHMINIQSPKNPFFRGCYSGDGYTHDVQCVIYKGPDPDYQNMEICFACNEDTVTIVDVTNKNSPQLLSKTSYSGDQYTHQGWLTEDQSVFIFGDEGDETDNGVNTRTYLLDVTSLRNPFVRSPFTNSNTRAIDHNQYVRGDYSYQANYDAGVRVMDVSEASSGIITEVGYFDMVPNSNQAEFNGAWSVYPYFPSGTIVASGTNQGLYVLQPHVLLGEGPGAAREPSSLLYTEAFKVEGVGMAKSRAVKRVPAPAKFRGKNDNGVKVDVGRLLIPAPPMKRTTAALLEADEWIDLPDGATKIKVTAKFALAVQRVGRLSAQVVVQYDTGRWAAGTAIALGNAAHTRYVDYAREIAVPKNARQIKRVGLRVMNLSPDDVGVLKQVMYVANVIVFRSSS